MRKSDLIKNVFGIGEKMINSFSSLFKASTVILCLIFGANSVFAFTSSETEINIEKLEERRKSAQIIQYELDQRINYLEEGRKAAERSSNELQIQLSDQINKEKELEKSIVETNADIGKQDKIISELNGRIRNTQEKIDETKRSIQRYKDNEARRKAMCAIPFYGWVNCTIEAIKGWDRELNNFNSDLNNNNNSRNIALVERAKAVEQMKKLQKEYELTANGRAKLQEEASGTEQKLVDLNKEISKKIEAKHAYIGSMDAFDNELAKINGMPENERASVISRSVMRMNEQLAIEMGKACLIFISSHEPVPQNIANVCTAA
jgi:chromosome segregation ATPase